MVWIRNFVARLRWSPVLLAVSIPVAVSAFPDELYQAPPSDPFNEREHTMTNTIAQIEKILYTAKAHTTGGRDGGASRTSDGRLDLKLSVPGTHGTGTNPEQLFAVGWSACFLSAIKLVAGKMKVKLSPDVAVDAEVDLGTTNGSYLIQARLKVSLPGIAPDIAQKLLDSAHLACPYSKATHSNINVVTTLIDAGAATSVA